MRTKQSSFEQLVAEAYEPLQRYLRRRTDPGTADDVLGDVLLVMWRRAADIPQAALVLRRRARLPRECDAGFRPSVEARSPSRRRVCFGTG